MNRRAFTLTEILVAIAIVMVLAAISVPVYQRAKAAAKVSSSISKMQQWSRALALYRQDHDGGAPRTNSPSDQLKALGFTNLRELASYARFPESMFDTGGFSRIGLNRAVYVIYYGMGEQTDREFLSRYQRLGESTVWLVDITQNPSAEIEMQAQPRLVLGARLDGSVMKKRVRGDLTRTTIWEP